MYRHELLLRVCSSVAIPTTLPPQKYACLRTNDVTHSHFISIQTHTLHAVIYSPELLHSRVKNWTKNVDLFTKELVILPVCQRSVYICDLLMVDINDTMYSSHWYVAVICHAGLFEATSNRSTLTLNDSSTDIISGILDDPPLAVTSPQVNNIVVYIHTILRCI